MKRNIRKTKTNVEIIMPVGTHTHIVLSDINVLYILSLKLNIIKSRNMPFLDDIVLLLCAFAEKSFHKHMRCGP